MSAIRWQSVIWDFNGTLLDDAELAVNAINAQLVRRELPRLDLDRYRDVFSLPLAEYYRTLGFDLSVESTTAMADEFHEVYLRGLPGCRLHGGVRELLDRLDDVDVAQYVLSAMEETSLQTALERLGIADRFVAIYGLGDRLAATKIVRGREMMARFDIAAEEALLVGDTDHDADVARALGTSIVLVSRGHQSLERLRTLGVPVFESFGALERSILADGVA